MSDENMADDVYQPVGGDEEQEGESLDERLRQEVPDVEAPTGDGVGDLPGGEGEPRDPEVGADRAGRLVAPDEGTRTDTTSELVADDQGMDGGAPGRRAPSRAARPMARPSRVAG
ncbi:DUF5709 domain-containing protein [Streptomyces incanus]|uniref:DUF5709 domain-containing protein n=1 Tax=Streptomyces incanus TaxID=887453 RepID=A0ABW0XUE8_9ACTN